MLELNTAARINLMRDIIAHFILVGGQVWWNVSENHQTLPAFRMNPTDALVIMGNNLQLGAAILSPGMKFLHWVDIQNNMLVAQGVVGGVEVPERGSVQERISKLTNRGVHTWTPKNYIVNIPLAQGSW